MWWRRCAVAETREEAVAQLEGPEFERRMRELFPDLPIKTRKRSNRSYELRVDVRFGDVVLTALSYDNESPRRLFVQAKQINEIFPSDLRERADNLRRAADALELVRRVWPGSRR